MTVQTPIHALQPIEIALYEPVPDKPTGYIRYTGNRTYREVAADLNAALEKHGYAPDEYGMNLWNRWEDGFNPDAPLPRYRWVASYVVTGGSEGYYLHVDLLCDDKDSPTGGIVRVPFLLGKNLGASWEESYRMAAAIGQLLGA